MFTEQWAEYQTDSVADPLNDDPENKATILCMGI